MSVMLAPLGRFPTLFAFSAALLSFESPAQARDAYPFTLENCGRTLSFQTPPQRAVGLGQNSTEILLMLGLEDRMVGSAVWVSAVPPELAEAEAKVERLDVKWPSFEAVVAREPDFLAVQFQTAVGEAGAVGTREQFADLGIESYISPTECSTRDNAFSTGTRPDLFSPELLYVEVEELARIFDVRERGEAIVADLRAREAAVREKIAGRAADVSMVFWFSSADVADNAWVAGQNGASGHIAAALGARNVIDSLEEWPYVGWETIVEADPTVIVIGAMERRTQGGDDPAVKRAFLTSDPVVSQMEAVREGRIVELEAQAMNPTIRTISGLETVAEALDELGLLK